MSHQCNLCRKPEHSQVGDKRNLKCQCVPCSLMVKSKLSWHSCRSAATTDLDFVDECEEQEINNGISGRHADLDA